MSAFNQQKGFTLIELLIVVGILAVLATATILVLNPVQLFAQARDSQRLADLGSIKGALSLYLTTAQSPNLGGGSGFVCGSNWGASVAGAATTFSVATNGLAHAGVRTVDGEGWVAVDFSSMTGGSPLPVLPKDPVNSADQLLYYGYSCDNSTKTFELNANMESDKYKKDGPDDTESTDGGTNADIFETGNAPGLAL